MNRPWMPLYVADYRADTAHLNAAQHGAYLLLIMHYWQTGSLPTDDAPLARIACMTAVEWRKSKAVIAAFFTPEWKHKRIDAELARAADISSKRRASAEQRHSKRDANAELLDTHARTCAPASPSHSQRKDNAADAATTNPSDEPTSKEPYAFESGVIRLRKRDFDQWKQAFSHLDVPAELIALAAWAQTQPKWFHAVSGALAKRNREVGLRLEQSKTGGKTANELYWGNRTPGIA